MSWALYLISLGVGIGVDGQHVVAAFCENVCQQGGEGRLAHARQILQQKMAVGEHFRHDLFFRLRYFHINVPPLRERVEDIAPLSLRFLERANLANECQVTGVDEDPLFRGYTCIKGRQLADQYQDLLQPCPYPGEAIAAARPDVVVLLHASIVDSRAWEPLTPVLLDAGYRVVAVDRRGTAGDRQRARRRPGELERSHIRSGIMAGEDPIKVQDGILICPEDAGIPIDP